MCKRKGRGAELDQRGPQEHLPESGGNGRRIPLTKAPLGIYRYPAGTRAEGRQTGRAATATGIPFLVAKREERQIAGALET